MLKVIVFIVLFLYSGFLPRGWLSAHEADTKTLINIVKTGDIEVLSQLISDHKIDNATMVESVPLANALLHAGQLDLLSYAMFKGVYLVLDDYLEYKSINGFFNFVKKQKKFEMIEKVTLFFKSTKEKQIKKESDAFLSPILDSWVNVGNFLQESMRAYSKIIKEYKDTKLDYNKTLKKNDETQLEHNFRVKKKALINEINDKARTLKKGLSPYVALTQYKGKTFFEYIYLIMDILFAYPNQLLSSEFFLLFNEIKGLNGNTLLHDAILQQKNAVIEKICSIATWNFQVPNNDGKNPLMLAIDKVDYDAVILFKYKHNLLSFDELFRLIHFIGSAFNALLLHERDIKAEYRSWLMRILSWCDIDVFQKIFAHKNSEGDSLLHILVKNKNYVFLEVLLEVIAQANDGRCVDQDILDGQDEYPLFIAVKNNDERAVDWLLKIAGSNVNRVLYSIDAFGKGILHYAILQGNLKIIHNIINFLSVGSSGNNIPLSQDSDNNTLLHVAAYKGNKDIFNVLYEQMKNGFSDAINIKNNAGATPLAIALAYGASIDFITFLLNLGASIDFVDKNNAGILHYSALGASKEVYIFLKEKLSRYRVYDANVRSPLFYACVGKNSELIKYLDDVEESAFHQDSSGFTLVHALGLFISPLSDILCVKKQGLEFLLPFITRYKKEAKEVDSAGRTPLLLLCEGDPDYERLNAVDSALLRSWRFHICDALLLAGVDPDAVDQDGNRAIDFVASDLKIQQLLINAGSKPDGINKDFYKKSIDQLVAKNWQSVTPFMFARHLALGNVSLHSMSLELFFIEHNDGARLHLYLQHLEKTNKDLYADQIDLIKDYWKRNIDVILDDYKIDQKVYNRSQVLISTLLSIPELYFSLDVMKKVIEFAGEEINNLVLNHRSLADAYAAFLPVLLVHVLVAPIKNKRSSRLGLFRLYYEKAKTLGLNLWFWIDDDGDTLLHKAVLDPYAIECLQFLLENIFPSSEIANAVIKLSNKKGLSVFDVALNWHNINAVNLLRPFIRSAGFIPDFSMILKDPKSSYLVNEVYELSFLKHMQDLQKENKLTPEERKKIIALIKKDNVLMHMAIDHVYPLHAIVKSRDSELLSQVLSLSLGEDVLRVVDAYGNTALHYAAEQEDQEVIQLLNKSIPLMGVRNYYNQLPLQLVKNITTQTLGIINLLLAHYDVNPVKTGMIYENPFITIARSDNLRPLLPQLQRITQESDDIVMSAEEIEADLVFLEQLIQSQHIHFLCALLYHANSRYLRDHGSRLLLKAIEGKKLSAVIALVHHGVEITQECEDKVDALIKANKKDFFQKIVSSIKGTNDDSLGKMKIFFVAQKAAWKCLGNDQDKSTSCSALVSALSPLAYSKGNYPLHFMMSQHKVLNVDTLKTLLQEDRNKLALTRKNKDKKMPIHLFFDNLPGDCDDATILSMINLFLFFYVGDPVKMGAGLSSPFMFSSALNSTCISQLRAITSFDKKIATKEDCVFLEKLIKEKLDYIFFALLHHYNHLFMFNKDTDQLFHTALLEERGAIIKALVYYGVSDPQALDWQSENVEIFTFLEQQKQAWVHLSLMIDGGLDDSAVNVRLGQIMKILSPYEVYKGNTALHVIAGAAKSSNLLKHFITSHHFMAIDRLNQKREIPFLTALYNQQYQNAGMLFMVKGGFNRSYDVELRADVLELINVAAHIKPPASYVLNLKRLLEKAIKAKTKKSQ